MPCGANRFAGGEPSVRRHCPVWSTAISFFRPEFKDIWAYRQLYEAAMAALSEKAACRLTVDVLALAHERGCEAELATVITGLLAAGALPDMVAMRARFSPDPATLPNITVLITPLSDYNALLAAMPAGEAA